MLLLVTSYLIQILVEVCTVGLCRNIHNFNHIKLGVKDPNISSLYLYIKIELCMFYAIQY